MGRNKDYKKHLAGYVKENLDKGYSVEAIEKILNDYGCDSNFVSELIKSYKLKKILNFITIFFIPMLLISLIFFIKPNTVGHATEAITLNFTDKIGLTFNHSTEYPWNLQNNGELKSVKLNGKVKAGGLVKIYLEHENISYVIFDNSRIKSNALGEITAFDILEEQSKNESEEQAINETSLINQTTENETTINETINTTHTINKSINIELQYNKNTPYDENNDGIENINGVIDLTVDGTKFNWEADIEKLCTRWEVYNIEEHKSTITCNGYNDCCAFIGLLPSRSNWSEAYYSTYGKDGAGYDNAISAQVIYYDVNLSGDNLKSEIYYSDWQNLTAKFYEDYIDFEKICFETCILPNLNAGSYSLKIEIENSNLILDSISYEILGNKEINHAPALLKNFSNISIAKEQTYALNLSEYFFDEDNDNLSYNFYNSSEIGILIENETATLTPKNNFTGIGYIFFTANDSMQTTTSNIFSVDVEERKIRQISGKGPKSLRQIIGLI